LRYHRFSVVMHKTRRLPLITAANVDWRPAARPLDPKSGRAFSRGALSGIDENAAEQWVTDERIAPAHQLPDVFFTRDGGAFDKGHVVRRDDVCWGKNFEDVQMANGDTYHVTNCTPQVKRFNQSAAGTDNWGDFENELQKVTRAQRVCIFAGPVFAPDDRWFRGRDDGGAVRIQVPSRFWKIVVSNEGGAKAWGFVFEQDVTAITEKELAFDARWRLARRPIKDIAALLRGWLDLRALKAIDQPL
jgi:endonuclease G